MSTEFGIQIDNSDEQPENADDSMRRSFEGVSKMTSRRDLHQKKQVEQRILTEFGIQIDDSDKQRENVNDSMRRSFECVSKVTSRREWQFTKLFEQRISTEFGMQIDRSRQQAKAEKPIRQTRESFSNRISLTESQFEKHETDKT
jgi:hypothetical protein